MNLITKTRINLYKGFYDQEDTKIYTILNLFVIISIIGGSIIDIILTFNNLNTIFVSRLRIIEKITYLIFGIEFILRIWSAPLHDKERPIKSIFKYIFSFYGIIDLIVLIPIITPLKTRNLSYLRLIRIIKVGKLLKLTRYLESLQLIIEVIKDKSQYLISIMSVLGLTIFISSMLMYSLEHEAQPEKFENALSGLWWAIISFTTVGYGDIYPITDGGKILASFSALIGIAAVAIPTGIISAGLSARFEEEEFNKSHQELADIEAKLDKIMNHLDIK